MSNKTHTAILLLLFFIIFAYIFTYPFRINDNAALLLQTGELLWEGKMPYVDFFALDPPLIFYLNAIPVAVASLISVDKILVFSIFVGLMTLYSTISLMSSLKNARLGIDGQQISTLAIFFTFFSIWVLAKRDWGERDHLFTLALIPFLALRFARNKGTGPFNTFHAVCVGALIGIFTDLKPYYLLIIASNELYYMIRSRSFKSLISLENSAFLIMILLYLLHLFFLPQEMNEAYFHRWLPMLVTKYDLWNNDYLEMILGVKFYLSAAVLLFASAALRSYSMKISLFLPPLFIAFITSVLIFFIQHKGFLYHLIPAMGVLSLIVGIFYIEVLEHSSKFFKAFFRLAVGISALACIIYLFIIPTIRAQVPNPINLAIETYTRPKEGVLILSSTVYDPYPAIVEMQRKPGSRYITTFPFSFLPKKVDYSDEKSYGYWRDLTRDEKTFIQDLLDDIHAYHPPLLLIKMTDGCQGCPKNFNIYKYLEKIGFISQIEEKYTRQHNIKDFAVYTQIGSKN